MHLFIASGLLMVCGIVDATFYNPRSQAFNQLMERRQRSAGLQYPYGYHYNPIEPSINDLDGLSEALDSRINAYKPIYEHVKMSTHEVNSVPRTHSYKPKNPLYDSEYMTVQDIPSLFPEDSYDYKYLGSPLNKYLTQPSTTESSIPINLVAIRKTSVFGYGFPTYKSPYSLDSGWNFGSKIPKTSFGDSQSVETDPETFKVPSPTETIVKLLPETLKQELTPTTTKNPYDFMFIKLLIENQNEVKNLVEDELNYKTTQGTPIEDELNPINSEESQTMDQSNILVLEEHLTEDESNSITTEETLTEDESNSITTEKTQTEDELNSLVFDSFIAETESNSITTEDESNSITTEDELNSITTEENQTEDDESKLTTSQETTTAFKQHNLNWFPGYDKDTRSKIMEVLENSQKFREQKMKLTTIGNIFQSSELSEEDMGQSFVPKVANEDEFFYD